jgi:hypothetical protein
MPKVAYEIHVDVEKDIFTVGSLKDLKRMFNFDVIQTNFIQYAFDIKFSQDDMNNFVISSTSETSQEIYKVYKFDVFDNLIEEDETHE